VLTRTITPQTSCVQYRHSFLGLSLKLLYSIHRNSFQPRHAAEQLKTQVTIREALAQTLSQKLPFNIFFAHSWQFSGECLKLGHYISSHISSKYSFTKFYILLTVHLSSVLVNNQIDAQFFFLYIYSNSLHVSSTPVLFLQKNPTRCNSVSKFYYYSLF
jgi:hypothetical protein